MAQKTIKRILYIARGHYVQESPFDHFYDEVKVIGLGSYQHNHIHFTENDTLLLEGGEDINPKLYDSKPNVKTHYNDIRDGHEVDLLRKASDSGASVIGLCRGAQLLCAAAGGILAQHVSNHGGGSHDLQVFGKYVELIPEIFRMNSIHHQMMYPFGLDSDKYEIIASTLHKISTCYEGESENIKLKVPLEPEIVWFPELRGLAIQGHPEWMNSESVGVRSCQKLVEHLIIGG